VQSLAARLREATGDPAAAEALERALGVLEANPAGAASPVGAGGDGASAATGEAPAPAVRLTPPPDPRALGLEFEAALDSGNLDETRKRAVLAAGAYRTAGQFHAAFDACYEALASAPADPGLHFMLAQLYLDRGWRSLAADKLVLIGRLAQLSGDTATRARLCDLAVRRFPDDVRLAAMCA
jgi:hypothetical protein